MESRANRRIKEGKEFDHLFPSPGLNDTTVKKSAGVEDTVALIERTVPKTLWHTEKIAKELKGKTLDETCSNIWHFVYEHIQYKKDRDGVEQIRSPRRTWWERSTGVDCDCYTEFILSILLSLGIPSVARITKYPKPPPEVPRWQHIYPIVPRNGKLDRDLSDRDDYIVIDCVKDDYDSEQPFLEHKDYNMRLDYLDGIDNDDELQGEEILPLLEYDSVDAMDIAELDDEELGSILKKIGKAVKTVAKKVGTTAKVVAKKVGTSAKVVAKNVGASAKVAVKKVATTAKKVGDKVGEGVRFLNRYTNPATILLRNGFLLAMKINLLNVAGRLRYAYLTDAQAQQKGINLSELKKLRSIKDRAETVYWQAGGKKENLKKAILSGKGNKDKKVSLSGLFGFDDNVYMDLAEYNIIHSDPNNLDGLGEIASGAAIAAATSAVAAIAASLKQIKGLFNKGGQEEQSFQSESNNAGTAASVKASIAEDEDQMLVEEYGAESEPDTYTPPQEPSVRSFSPPPVTQPKVIQSNVAKAMISQPVAKPVEPYTPPADQNPLAPETEEPAAFNVENELEETITTPYETTAATQSITRPAKSNKSVLPASASIARRSPSNIEQTAETAADAAKKDDQKAQGFIVKTTEWIKTNPGKSLLIAGAVAGSGFLLAKSLRGGNNSHPSNNAVSGLPKRKKHKRKKNKKNGVDKIQSITL